jgi:hypothetical protein
MRNIKALSRGRSTGRSTPWTAAGRDDGFVEYRTLRLRSRRVGSIVEVVYPVDDSLCEVK